ncbi:MAG TPA: CvpA family protein, partial [candidate division Zixibacteria bacterium]|nr:CvpA family protein [candidate division Zixibacteria bacterium]
FVAALLVSIKYIDKVAIKVHEQLGGSTMVSAFISFILVLAGAYAVFKLLGIIFYRVAKLNTLGRKDKVGGALVGALRGWLALSLLVFLTFLMPLPERYYTEFKSSTLGPTIARTLPLLYESTSPIHPSDPSFVAKVENMLLYRVDQSELTTEQREAVRASRRNAYRTIYLIDSVLSH